MDGFFRLFKRGSRMGQHALQLQPETAGTMAIAGPSTAGTALQAQGVTISNGDLVQAGRDAIVTHHHHHHSPAPKVDIAFLLRLVRNLRQIQQDNFSKATPGTGVWILITKEFILWLDPNGTLKILWGTGIPGAGKTVLASIVINDLEKRAAADGHICVAYIYFRYTDGAELTVRDVLETLVKQTVERHADCAAFAEEAYGRHVRENTQPSEAELLQLLRRFTATKSITFYVLDALDEAPVRIQVDVVRKLASLNVRLFITSRPLKVVEARVPDAHGFTITAQEDDLDLHISQQISRSRDLQDLLDRADPSTRDKIMTRIKKNCGGMFLHASLQLNELCDCASPYEAMEVLDAFPPKIEEVYHRTWDRILKQRQATVARAVFLWVIYAARPMTIDELERAVATCPTTFKFEAGRMLSRETLVTICCGLVTIEDDSRLVRLVHYTAKEPLQKLLESPCHAHTLLAAVCMAHLTQCGFQNAAVNSYAEFRTILQGDPLLAYASEAWATHAQNSLEDAESCHRTSSFISNCKAFPCYSNYRRFDILGPLHILADYRLPFYLMARDEIDNPNFATRTYKATPLILASSSGNEDMVQNLLHLQDIQINATDDDEWSALMYAARRGHEGVFRFLIARPEILVNLCSSRQGSALVIAARDGHIGVVKLLLGHPAIQVNLVDGDEDSALAEAASRGHEEVVKLLLDHPNIQVNLVNSNGRSALMRAAFHGYEGAVKFLLDHPDIQVNMTNAWGESALVQAHQRGHRSIVSALLAHPGIQDDRQRLPPSSVS